MSTSLSGLSTNFFPSAQNGFQTTLASTISSGAATVPLNSVAGYTNGQIGVFVVDPSDATKKQTFTGVIDTAGVQVTSVVWTAGTNQTHTGGATVVDYATATHISMITKGITQSLNQDGSLIGSAVRTALGQVAQTGAGWTTLGNQPNTITANGNHYYTCVFNAVDLTGTVSPGMRLMTTRTVAAPTKSTSLNGTTQYYSKTSPAGMTATDNITVMGWIKPSAYQLGILTARKNGTTDGWHCYIDASGRIVIGGVRAADDSAVSYQSVPLNKWVHVAATISSTGAVSTMYLDGASIPVAFTNNANSAFLTPTGSFTIGAEAAAANPFAGKIAQLAVFSAVLSQATIQSYMSQGLAGTETSLISAYSFNNSINDLNANANNLTANGSAVATATDSPFGGQADGTISSTLDYAEIVSATFSTNTTLVVRVPDVNTIPTSGGVSAISYSTVQTPYGWPGISKVWGSVLWCSNQTGTATATGTQLNGGAITFTAPTGNRKFIAKFYAPLMQAGAGVGVIDLYNGATQIERGQTNTTTSLTLYVVSQPLSLTSGSQTFSVNAWETSAGTFTIGGGTSTPAYFSIEEV